MGWRTVLAPRTSEIAEGKRSVEDSAMAGGRWVTISQVANQATRLLTSIVLARLLVPEDFGLMAMVGIVTTALDRTIGQNVTGSAVIHRPAVTPQMASSVFILNVSVGLGIGAFIFLAADALAWVVGDERTADLFRVIALLPIVTSFGYIHRALLRRSLRFGRFAAIEYSHAITNAVVAIPAAIAGLGVWALVAGSLSGALVSTLLSWLLSPWKPLAHFSPREIREISGYSANLGMANLSAYAAEYGDRYVIGRFVGTAALGFYNVAFRLLLSPVKVTSNVAVNVLFPVFARMGDDRGMGRGYLRAATLITALTLPAMVGLAILAEPFVLAILGAKWAPAIPLVSVIALAAPLVVLASSMTPLYYAKGRTGTLLAMSVAHSALLLVAYVVGAQWGAAGVAWAFFLEHVVTLYFHLRIPLAFVGLAPRDLVAKLVPAAMATAVMAAAVLPTRLALDALGWGSWPVLAVCVPLGVAVYAAIFLPADRSVVTDFLRVVGRPRHGPVGVTEASA